MKKLLLLTLLLFIIPAQILFATSLQDAYINSNPGLGYDRLIILQADVVYTGGLSITNESIGIKGRGAILNLSGSSIYVTGDSKIEMDACVIINGSNGIHATGNAQVLLTQCTFYNNQNGIMFDSDGIIEVLNTIISFNSQYGLACNENSTCILSYIDSYQNADGNFMKWCPG
jgi:hypothetical protein